MPSPRAMPGTKGKIGKLMERGPTPTVMKHSGRIQIPRNTATSANLIQSPMTSRSGKFHVVLQDSKSLLEIFLFSRAIEFSYGSFCAGGYWRQQTFHPEQISCICP